MKNQIIAAILVMPLTAAAQNDAITLDLTKAETKLEFDAGTGAWTGTYNDDEYTIDSQIYTILHNSMGDYNTWWGFTASNSADNSMRDDFLTYQFSNMATGGIVLNADGTVKKDKFGAPAVSADVPYLVAFANNMFAQHPAEVVMADGEDHEAVGAYVCLNSYTYYSITDGDGFAREFTNGDKFTLTVHGVNSKEEESTLEVPLASYSNGDLTATRGWKYVDLSPLGKVNTLWFSMKSTDSGTYGDNTPSYFCLDKLMVKPASEISGAASATAGKNVSINYDRTNTSIRLVNADFAIVYDVAGNMVMSADSVQFSVESLAHGVYVVKAGNASRKIVR